MVRFLLVKNIATKGRNVANNITQRATVQGERRMANRATASRHYATSLAIAKGVPIRVGDTVRRNSDKKMFHVGAVDDAYGIMLDGFDGYFAPAGFTKVNPR